MGGSRCTHRQTDEFFTQAERNRGEAEEEAKRREKKNRRRDEVERQEQKGSKQKDTKLNGKVTERFKQEERERTPRRKGINERR